VAEPKQSSNRRSFLLGTGAMLGGFLPASRLLAEEDQQVQAPSDQAFPMKPTGADIGSLYSTIERMAGQDEFAYSFLGDRFRSLEDFKAAGRAKLIECFGRQPAKVEPRVEVLDRQDKGDYIQEKILFSTTPHLRVPAYLLIPKTAASQPHPAIVDLHSHGGMYLFGKEKVVDLGDNHPAMQKYHSEVYGGRATATELVRRGYVVITIDAFMFGERRLMMDQDLAKYGWDRSKYSMETVKALNQVCGSKESTLVNSLSLAGFTWPGVVTWDDLRTVDYLASRPEVDASRIGCVGVSMGGHRALYLAGLDDRIAAACVVGFMSTVRPMIKAHIDTHSAVHFVPSLHQYLDLPDVVSMMAPKPLMVQQCRKDALYPPEGMRQSIEKIAKVYEKADVGNQFAGRFYDGGHRFDQAMQNDAFDWLDAHLNAK